MANYTEKNYDPSIHGWWKGVNEELPNFGYPVGYYYADTIRNIMIAFGNYFNELYVVRRNEFQEPVKIIRVPLKYGPRQKSHDFRTEQESGNTYYITLPNMTYKIDGISYAGDRDSGIYETRAFYNDVLSEAGIEYEMEEQYWSDMQPAPCNINISMEINCEKIDDLNQIIEQIMPRFRPEGWLAMKEFWWFNKRRSIKMKMNDPGIQIENDSMSEEDKRSVKGTLSFTIEAVMYKPIQNAQIIEKINTFMTMKHTAGAIWHSQIFGNANGTLNTKLDFSNIYGTKVANSFVLEKSPETTYDANTSAYITIFDYKQTDALTTYDKDAKLLKKITRQWSPANNPIFTTEELYDDINYRYYTSAVPHFDEWVVTKEYMALSGWGYNDDHTITFGNKVLYDKDDTPYSAYYSTYTEEGSITSMNYKFDNKTNKLSFSGKYDSQ